MYLIDTHSHLCDTKFDNDRLETIQRASEKGVKKIIEIGCDPSLWDKVLNLADSNADIYCALGIHPQEASKITQPIFEKLENLSASKKVIAIGETGLDYYHENSPRDIQKEVFLKHIQLALKTNKPLVIHCRDAYNDMIEILKDEFHSNKNINGVIHCFSGSIEHALWFTKMGFILGIDGPVTYPTANKLRHIVENIPLEKIILETDSPYLTPQDFRGKRNEPAYLYFIAEQIAKIRQTSIENIISITTSNAQKLFHL